jgi:hypothetical protein
VSLIEEGARARGRPVPLIEKRGFPTTQINSSSKRNPIERPNHHHHRSVTAVIVTTALTSAGPRLHTGAPLSPHGPQREALSQFIMAGWTPAELGEYARRIYLVPGQTKPTAASYRFILEKGPDHEWAKEALATMRVPGYFMPAFDRPEPKHYEWDDPDNPKYSEEVRSAVYTLARGCMAAYDDRLHRPRRGPDTPIRKGLLRSCFRELYAADDFGLRSGAR